MDKTRNVVNVTKDKLLKGDYTIQYKDACLMLFASVVDFNMRGIKKALNNGADINSVTSDGYTPIAVASIFEEEQIAPDYKIIKALIKKGADLTIANNKGNLPFENFVDKFGPTASLVKRTTKKQAKMKKNFCLYHEVKIYE